VNDVEIAPRKSASHGEAGYARNARDFYPTEPWVTRALLNAVELTLTPGMSRTQTMVWEPACGDGRMAEVLKAAGYEVASSDIADYGYALPLLDFLDPIAFERLFGDQELYVAAIVTNPPFDLAVQFIQRALKIVEPVRGKVAILQRHEFDAPKSNHPLFEPPFAAKLVLHKRPRWSDENKASPRFPYAWYLWDFRHQGPPILRYLPDPDKPQTEGRLL
jgi:hypothetical protein